MLIAAPERYLGAGHRAGLARPPAAGLKDGDIITAVDGQRIDGTHSLDDILTQYAPGDELTLSILRDGQPQDLTSPWGRAPAPPSQAGGRAARMAGRPSRSRRISTWA